MEMNNLRLNVMLINGDYWNTQLDKIGSWAVRALALYFMVDESSDEKKLTFEFVLIFSSNMLRKEEFFYLIGSIFVRK